MPSALLRLVLVGSALAAVTGCVRVSTAPIEVKPIHITVDVNVRVERALDDFFGAIDARSDTIAAPAATTPAP